MNHVVAIGTTIDKWKAGPVMMRRMTLQAERRLADRKQVSVRRPVCRVTLHAVFVHRCVLVREWPLQFSMAGKAKLIDVCLLQVVSGSAAMGIMTIHAAHFCLADRMVVGQIRLSRLLLMTLQTVGVDLAPRFQWCLFAVKRVAPGTFHILCLMLARKPIAHLFLTGMAAQTHAVGYFRLCGFEVDDLGRVALGMQTAGAVAVFALNSLERMKTMLGIVRDILVTGSTLLRACFLGTRDDKIYRTQSVVCCCSGPTGPFSKVPGSAL